MDIHCRLCLCIIAFLSIEIASAWSQDQVPKEKELEKFIDNSCLLTKYCCSIDVEVLHTTPVAADSGFNVHTFIFCQDTKLGLRRYDHITDFEFGQEDRMLAGRNTLFVDDKARQVTVNDGAIRVRKKDWEEVKKATIQCPVCTPFGSVLGGYSCFFGSKMSMLTEDDCVRILINYQEEDRQEMKDCQRVEYSISRKLPVYASVQFSNNFGGMPKSINLTHKWETGKSTNLGESAIVWAQMGDAWVPITQRSVVLSSDGKIKIECSVKYNWTQLMHNDVWLTGEDPRRFLLPFQLKEWILQNQVQFPKPK